MSLKYGIPLWKTEIPLTENGKATKRRISVKTRIFYDNNNSCNKSWSSTMVLMPGTERKKFWKIIELLIHY